MNKFKKGQIFLRDYSATEAKMVGIEDYFVLFYVDDVAGAKVEVTQLTLIDEGASRHFDFHIDSSFAQLSILLTP